MDYQTKPMSRNDLRAISIWFRKIFRNKTDIYFDVIKAFEKIHNIFPNITTEIIEDDDLSVIEDSNVPGTCMPDLKGNYHICIREKVYDGALKNIGGYRMHIVHEMCHAVLCLLGFTPNLDRTFQNNELPAYQSVEWQAKALAGEILIPYERTKFMSVGEIMYICKVSKAAAIHRFNQDMNFAPEFIIPDNVIS